MLIAEIQSRHEFNFTLQKILPQQISLMINNFQTVVKLQKANVAQERENLRSLILSSISHDLKTPLSSIIAGLSVFNALSSKNKLDEKSKKILINTALEEAERLNEFISEILEMTRIESGAITLNKQLLEAAAGLLGGRQAESFIHLLELAMDLDRKARWGLLPALLEDPLEA